MDDYLGRVQSLVISLTGTLSAQALDEAQHLIDHGEPAEGVLYLAWGITNEDRIVSAECLNTIFELTDGLVSRADFPPGFAERSSFDDGRQQSALSGEDDPRSAG